MNNLYYFYYREQAVDNILHSPRPTVNLAAYGKDHELQNGYSRLSAQLCAGQHLRSHGDSDAVSSGTTLHFPGELGGALFFLSGKRT